MGWRVKRNALPKIAVRLPREIDKSTQDMADDVAQLIEANIWKDTGVAQATVSVEERSQGRAEVWVGRYLGKGFYVGFHELGTKKLRARPVVVPAAHEAEPIFASYIERAVGRAVK